MTHPAGVIHACPFVRPLPNALGQMFFRASQAPGPYEWLAGQSSRSDGARRH
jgi:hypothetical protein